MRVKKRSLELLNFFFCVFCFGDKYKSTGRELSFEWSHHRTSSADSIYIEQLLAEGEVNIVE